MSAKIYSIAKQLLGALLVVTIPRISSEIATKTIDFVRNRLEEIFSYIIMITGPASVGMFMLSRNIVYFLSGNEYIQATTSLKILSIALVFAILVTFYVYVILIPFKKEKIALFSTMLSAFVNLLLNIVLIPIFSEKAAAFTTLLSELITMIIGIIYVRKIVKLNTYKPLLVGIVNSIITFIVCKLVLSFEITNLLQIVFSVVIVGLITLLNIAIFHFTKKKKQLYFLMTL